MQSVTNAQQIYPSQPLWIKVKNKAELSKEWISSHCVKTLQALQDKISHTSFQPFYERSIKPLNKVDAFALIGVPLLSITISIIAYYALGELACMLAVFLGSTICGLAIAVPIIHLHNYHNKEALPYLNNLTKAVENSQLSEVYKQLGILESSKFSHLEKDVSHLRQEFNSFKQSRLPMTENKKVFLAYVNEFKKRLGIQSSPNPQSSKRRSTYKEKVD